MYRFQMPPEGISTTVTLCATVAKETSTAKMCLPVHFFVILLHVRKVLPTNVTVAYALGYPVLVFELVNIGSRLMCCFSHILVGLHEAGVDSGVLENKFPAISRPLGQDNIVKFCNAEKPSKT